VDLEQVRAVVRDTLLTMREMPEEPFRDAKTIFPAVWCEWTSVAMARVLEARELGEWTLVSAGAAGGSGHAWLELRDGSEVVMSVDATLHQFPEWDKPFVAYGKTPAAQKFPEQRYAGPWSDWPVLDRNLTFREYSNAVLRRMALA
jgi:hypothetical protein